MLLGIAYKQLGFQILSALERRLVSNSVLLGSSPVLQCDVPEDYKWLPGDFSSLFIAGLS